MKKKKIGVIISCYNHVNYIEQAINSILDQTYKDFEIYAADDASNDGTKELLLQFENDIKEIHLFEDNQGERNTFLAERVDNEFTALINSDDYWHEEKLEKQINYMQTHPDCAACFSWCRQVNDKGEKIQGIAAFQQTNRSAEEWIQYMYYNGNCLAHPSVLIRTSIYKKLNYNSYKAFRQIPDFQIWVELLLKDNIHIIEEELMSFRWHSSDLSTNVSAVTNENIARHLNEECYMWYETIANMNNEFFLKAFKDNLIINDSITTEEIMCEKFFLLASSKNDYIRQAAIFYFYDIFKIKSVQECFHIKYKFSKKDFYKFETEIGYGKLFLDVVEKKQIMREMVQCIINANL